MGADLCSKGAATLRVAVASATMPLREDDSLVPPPPPARAAAAAPDTTPPWGGTVQPSARGQRERSHPSARMDKKAQLIMVVGQLLIVVTQLRAGQGSLPLPLFLAPITVLLLAAAVLLFMLWRPESYWQHRPWLLPAWMLLQLIAAPSQRNAGVGMAQILERPPRVAGMLGPGIDLLRVASGTRALPWAVWSASVLLPPTATLVLHAGVVALTANVRAYCATPILTGQLAAQRQAAAAALLDSACVPLAAVEPAAGQIPHAPLAGAPLCHATVSWLHLTVGLLLPLLLSVWRWQPAEQQEAAGGGAGGSGSTGTCARQLAHLASRAAAASDRALHRLLGGTAGHPAVRAAIAWFVAANCWLLCR